MAIVKWIDLSSVNVFLGAYLDANKQSGLCLIDVDRRFDAQIRAMGFVPAAGPFSDGVYMNAEKKLTPELCRTAFGKDAVKFFGAEQSLINKQFADKIKEVTETNSKTFFSQQRAIGFNDLGEVVQESVIGRYVVRSIDGSPVIIREVRGDDPATFLRVTSKADLRRVAKGFVLRITARNEKLRKEHLQRLMTVSNDAGYSPREYQEAIEFSLNELFSDEVTAHYASGAAGGELASFDVANKIYLGMPELKERTPNSIANQQYSTPVPISALAQSILARRADLNGASVLESTIGNGNLVSMLNAGKEGADRCAIYGVEIDPERVEQAQQVATQVILGDATQIDFRRAFSKPNGFDFVIANPPFGSMDKKVAVKLPDGSLTATMDVLRIDQYILLESLHARSDSGRAVFITGADSVLEKGDIKGRSKHLLNYLYDHYEVEGVVDVAGELYKKQGAEFPLRLYVIGARREVPVVTPAPESLPVIRTYEGLRDWAKDVIDRQKPLTFGVDDLLEVEAEAPEVVESVAHVPPAGEVVATVAADKIDDRTESQFQQRYIAFSNVGEASTMIPANLSGPVYESLAAIKERYGDIDEYVAKELDFSFADLQQYFMPEQVDALAMVFHAHDRKLGFLLADQMGVGKGRVLAAVARRERLQGRIPMFVTVTPNLFSDFLERDLVSIGSRNLFHNPMIVNDGVKTVDGNGDVIVSSMKRSEYRLAAETGSVPEGTDLILLTYSQIARRFETHVTSRYMRDICQNDSISLLLDESHNGAGESNTGVNLAAMIENIGTRGNVIYSSGTPIKGAKNLKLYKKILPYGVDADALLEAVNADPLSLQEALNYEIAVQGCLISRELDSTGIDKEYAMSPNVARNRDIADQMADIFSAMSYLSGDVSKVTNQKNKEFEKYLIAMPESERVGNRMGASSMNFGSRLHELNRQFLLALKAVDIIQYVRETLAANKKPIVAIQHTGESLLTDFMVKANEVYDNDPSRVTKDLSSITIERPVSFKDLMNKYLEKISWIKIQGRYGDVSYEQVTGKEMVIAIDRISNMIQELPDDLPLTPIDFLREELGKYNYTVGEVSGRNLMARTLENGSVEIGPVPGRNDKTRVNRVVREFNNGDIDVLVLTGSGSTGISLQASPAVGRDVRARKMFKWEMQPNIASERQMDGRHNRTGQIVAPEYCVPLTGLPADDRLSMMFNNKNRSLTASTVANRDSKELIREAPDLLNVVGDMAAEEMLFENPMLADRLDIKLPEDADERASKPLLWYSGKLSGRISLVKVAEQESIYAILQAKFIEKLDQLKAEGRNPLEVECHDWKAKVLSRTVFMGAKNSNGNEKSQLNSPIFVTELEYMKTLKAVKASEIDTKIAGIKAELSMFNESGSRRTIQNYIGKHRQDLLQRSLSKRFETIEAALDAKEPNEVQNMSRKIDWLSRNLPDLQHGAIVMRDDLDGSSVPHVILRYNLPTKIDGYSRLSDYIIYTMQPGSDQVEMHSLSTLFSEDVDLDPNSFEEHDIVRDIFDSAENGSVAKRATIFDGNLFEATTLNLREKIGRKIVYTDESGSRQHGILVRSDMSQRRLMEIPEQIRDVDLLVEIMAGQKHQITSHSSGEARKSADDVVIGVDRDGLVKIQVAKSKLRGGDVFLDPALSKIAGKEDRNIFDLKFSIVYGKMTADVKKSDINHLISYLVHNKNINFYVKDRGIIKTAREQLENLHENAAVIG